MDNFTIDQEVSGKHSSYALHLKGKGCHFSNFKAFGIPHDSNTQDCIYVEDGSAGFEGDDNTFTNFEAGNLIYTSGNKYRYGVNVGSGTQGNVFNNAVIKNCGTNSVYLQSAAQYNKALNITTDENTNIASAATITLKDYGKYFNITGTTNIDTITSSWDNRVVVLKFAGILTVGDDTGNIALSGSFTTSANDTLTLVNVGTWWMEVSRSAN